MDNNIFNFEYIYHYGSRSENFHSISLNNSEKTFKFVYKQTEDYMTGMDCSDYNYHFEIDEVEGTFELLVGNFLDDNSVITLKAKNGRHITDDEAYNYQKKVTEGINPKYQEIICKFNNQNLVYGDLTLKLKSL